MDQSPYHALIQQEIDALAAIPKDGSLDIVIDKIYQQVHVQGGKVIVSGVGKAGHIGVQIATTFCSTGTSASFLNPLDAQHGDLGILQSNDILLLISNSGETREIIELVHLARRLYNNIEIIVLTKHADSPLAQLASQILLTGDTKEICPLGLTPTVSTTVMKVIGDILIVELMKRIGFTKEAYAMRHHGGYLGQLSNA